ncbi:hypothetical protein D3C87_1144620 [compost metagenome]
MTTSLSDNLRRPSSSLTMRDSREESLNEMAVAGLALAPFGNTVKPPSTLSTQRTMASMSCVLLMKPCAPAW